MLQAQPLPTESRRLVAWLPRPFNLGMGVIALFWIDLWNALRVDWETNGLYSYGWCIPPAAFLLSALRWPATPAAEPVDKFARRLVTGIIVLLAIAQVPLRIVAEANPEWRAILWARELQCILLTASWIYLARGFKQVRYFIFPILFTALAVPWPRVIEDPTVLLLRRTITRLTVESLSLLNVPAVQYGNIIMSAAGPIGIEEACSGVRSLQSCLAMSVFLGALWLHSVGRRWLLVGVGIIFAFLLNFSRTLTLSWIFATRGKEAFYQWHGFAGSLELFAAMIILVIVAAVLAGWGSEPLSLPTLPRGAEPVSDSNLGHKDVACKVALYVMAGFWLAALAGTEWWFRRNDSGTKNLSSWTVVIPSEESPDFQRIQRCPLPERACDILRTTDGFTASWRTEYAQSEWQMVFIRWPQGTSTGVSAAAHHPDVCLTASGLEYLDEVAPIDLHPHGITIRFHHYRFRSGPLIVHAFYALSDSQGAGYQYFDRYQANLWQRLQFALAGIRNHGQTALGFYCLTDSLSGQAATAALPRFAERLLVRSAPGSR